MRYRDIARSGMLLLPFVFPQLANAASPSVKDALSLKPVQRGIDYQQPTSNEIADCTIKSEKEGKISGWVVRDANGQLLRRFLDTNNDNKVDRWCYYADGIEVYRDVDTDFNGKADQYRWLGTAGTRVGTDKNEDGKIDQWKAISPEEVSAEVVAALRDKNAQQFIRVLLTTSELRDLGLGDKSTTEISLKLKTARAEFTELASKQTTVKAGAEWVHFGGGRPGTIPAGTRGSTKDVTVYDNVSAVVEVAGEHAQVGVGTLVKVGDGWRVIHLPDNVIEGQVAGSPSGYFFQQAPLMQSGVASGPAGLSEKMQQLITELEKVDQQLVATSDIGAQTRFNVRRTELLEALIKNADNQEDRSTWVRQFADTISAASQSGQYPGGVARLKKQYDDMQRTDPGANDTAFVGFRYLSAAYGQSMQDPKADIAKIQDKWLADLNGFVKAYPRSDDAADAMLQLAVAKEFSGEDELALEWYGKVVSNYPEHDLAKKAAGAKRRLECLGKSIPLSGKSLAGRQEDLASYQGKVVVVHYWATWCEPCKQDLVTLRKMQAKYGAKGFALIGVNLDSERTTATGYLDKNPIPWSQLYEEGGLDSRFARELGILTLPTMILVDKRGKVVSRSIHAAELDNELGKLLR